MRGRGLKRELALHDCFDFVAPRAGARIETSSSWSWSSSRYGLSPPVRGRGLKQARDARLVTSPPVRGRGLKHVPIVGFGCSVVAPRAGARIETSPWRNYPIGPVAPRAGARIET